MAGFFMPLAFDADRMRSLIRAPDRAMSAVDAGFS
jgi:hypothetical protein